TGVEAKDRPTRVAANILSISTRRARHLAALLGLELDVVHDRANRHLFERHRVARLHVDRIHRRNHLVPCSNALRRKDVGLLTVFVVHQRNEGTAVGVVFEALNRADNVKLVALEVNQTIATLVTATPRVHRGAPVIVATTGLAQAFSQLLDRVALPQIGTVDTDKLAAPWRARIIMFQSHLISSFPPSYKPVEMSMDWPSTSVTIAFLTSLRVPSMLRNRFTLPLRTIVLTA